MSGGGFVVATSQITLTNAEIPDITFEANFSPIDAGIEIIVNSTETVEYIPLFGVADFNKLLQPGKNTIEIVNLNSFQGATLGGDYTVKLVAAVPEPSATSLCLVTGLFWIKRRRRK